MRVLNRYILKNLLLATVFIALTLSAVLILTQSLRFLELIIEAGAGAGTFWVLTFLALPRFLEILVPLSAMIAIIFVYSRMAGQSELVVLRTSGFSPMAIARPALILAMMMTVFLWFVTMWAAPKSLAALQHMRQMVKSQFSAALLQDGVFNRLGDDLTVYIQERDSSGALFGLMIYDKREKQGSPSTVLAERGILLEESDGYQVIVYDGTRQSFDGERRVLQRLDFERYTIDLPLSNDIRTRWREPDERTVGELLRPDLSVSRDAKSLRLFRVELHRRVTAPLLTFAFSLIAAAFLVLGPVNRHGNAARLIGVVVICVVLQGLFIAAYNIAGKSLIGIILMYGVVVIPSGIGFYLLSGLGENWRRHFLYGRRS